MTEWREYKLKELADFNPDSLTAKNKLEFINYLDTGNITKGKIDTIQYLNLLTDKVPSRAKRIVKKNDIVYSTVRPNQEHYGIIKNPVDNMIVSTGFVVLRSKEDKCYSDFLYYFLTLPENTEYLSNVAEDSTTAYPSITPDVIMDMDISLPPLPEQKAIAEVLSSLDDKIDLLTRQNKTLEDLAQAYFRKWFIEDASDEWEVGKLGDYIEIHDSKRVPLSKIEREKMKSGTLYPYYGAATIMDYVNDYIFDGEYILMGEDGTVETEDGYPILQYATGKFWVNNHAHVLTAKSPFNNYFIWFFLKQCNISGIVTGAVQPKINQENLKNIDIPIPDLTLINSANQFFANIFAKILNNLEQIKTFQKLRDTLLPKLISGEIRVKM